MNLPPTPVKLWSERYETLRRHFLDNRPLLAADPLGLRLLLHNGMANWIRTWQSGEAPEPKPSAPSPESGSLPIAPVWQQELTRLIAHMTAQHLRPTQML